MRQRALSLAVALIVGVALVSASGAATTKAQKVTKINVSTRAAVVHYLRSIHVNPKGAVIQRGPRNYAGRPLSRQGLDLREHEAHGRPDREARRPEPLRLSELEVRRRAVSGLSRTASTSPGATGSTAAPPSPANTAASA